MTKRTLSKILKNYIKILLIIVETQLKINYLSNYDLRTIKKIVQLNIYIYIMLVKIYINNANFKYVSKFM